MTPGTSWRPYSREGQADEMTDLDKEIERIGRGDAWDESDEVVEVRKPLDKVIPVRFSAEK